MTTVLKHSITVFLITIIGLLNNYAQNNNVQELFTQANQFYSDTKYQEALQTYLELEKQNIISPELYYNIGNTYYKLQNYPYAIYYYKKALKYRPSDKSILHNLKLARQHTVDKIDYQPTSPFSNLWKKLYLITTARKWSYLGIAFMFLTFAGLTLYRFSHNISAKRLYFVSATIALFFSILSLILGYQNQNYFSNTHEAVIVAPTISVYSEPNQKGSKLFTLHEGTEVVIEENLNNSVKIKLPNDKSGWVTRTDIKEI